MLHIVLEVLKNTNPCFHSPVLKRDYAFKFVLRAFGFTIVNCLRLTGRWTLSWSLRYCRDIVGHNKPFLEIV